MACRITPWVDTQIGVGGRGAVLAEGNKLAGLSADQPPLTQESMNP